MLTCVPDYMLIQRCPPLYSSHHCTATYSTYHDHHLLGLVLGMLLCLCPVVLPFYRYRTSRRWSESISWHSNGVGHLSLFVRSVPGAKQTPQTWTSRDWTVTWQEEYNKGTAIVYMLCLSVSNIGVPELHYNYTIRLCWHNGSGNVT